MLGEQLGELRGTRTARRVLSVDNGFKLEVAFESKGKLAGADVMEIGTYWSATRPGGGLYGEGQGVVMSQDGEVATWKGGGIGKVTGGGAVSFRVANHQNAVIQAIVE